MSRVTVGIVDYGIGNHSSVKHSLRQLGFRVHLTSVAEELDAVDAIVLPGVGAFPAAMQALHQRELVEYLRDWARAQRPIIGICLGMQLLTSASFEYQYTEGLNLVPGEVVPLGQSKWHIGWNTIECIHQDPMFQKSDGECFYFNHSFVYQGPIEHQVCIACHLGKFPAVIRRGSVVGLQFHPEKSQFAGGALLKQVIDGLLHA